MNERICELKEAAMEVIFSSPSTGREQKQLNVDKFAELIVRECCQYLENEAERLYSLSAKEDDPVHKEVYKANFEICAEKCYDNSQGLKDHFGVE